MLGGSSLLLHTHRQQTFKSGEALLLIIKSLSVGWVGYKLYLLARVKLTKPEMDNLDEKHRNHVRLWWNKYHWISKWKCCEIEVKYSFLVHPWITYTFSKFWCVNISNEQGGPYIIAFNKWWYSWVFLIFLHNIFWFGRNIFENFNISENNTIIVELAKVLGYLFIYEPPYQLLLTTWIGNKCLQI